MRGQGEDDGGQITKIIKKNAATVCCHQRGFFHQLLSEAEFVLWQMDVVTWQGSSIIRLTWCALC